MDPDGNRLQNSCSPRPCIECPQCLGLHNYYVSRLYSVYSYTIHNTVQALVLYHLWLYIYRHHYSKKEAICVRTMVVRSNLVHLADTATQAIQCV